VRRPPALPRRRSRRGPRPPPPCKQRLPASLPAAARSPRACACEARAARPRRVRDCAALEGVSEQARGWMERRYAVGDADGARAIADAEKAQRAGGCLHCKAAHRRASPTLTYLTLP